MFSIYLIERTVIDPSENKSCNAVFTVPFAYVFTRKKAERICNKSKWFTGKDCWALSHRKTREYNWKLIDYYK